MRFTFLVLAGVAGCAVHGPQPESVRPASAGPPAILCGYAFEAPEQVAGTLEHPETDRDCTLPDGSDDFSVGFRHGDWWLKVHVPRARGGAWTDQAGGMRAVAVVADEWCRDFDGRVRAVEEGKRWRLELELACRADPAIAVHGTIVN